MFIIFANLPSRTKKIIQGATGSKEEGSGNILKFGLAKRKVDAGQSSVSMITT
jgi:hypothetical protein